MKTKMSRIAIAVQVVLGLTACQSLQPGDTAALKIAPMQSVRHGAPPADAMYALGRYYQGQMRDDKAMDAYRSLVEAYPDHAEGRNALGMMLAAQGKYDAAIAEFEKAAAEAPESARIRNNLGYAYLLRGSFAQAVAVLETAARLDPLNPRVRENLQTALASSGMESPASPANPVATGEAVAVGTTADVATVNAGAVPAVAEANAAPVAVEAKSSPALVEAKAVPPMVEAKPVPPMTEAKAAPAAVEAKAAPVAVVSSMRLIPVAANMYLLSAAAQAPATTAAPAKVAPPAPEAAARVDAGIAGKRVRIEVSNGNGITGMARNTSLQLQGAGYAKARLTNELPYQLAATEIQYRPGFEPQAQELQSVLRPGVRVVASTRLRFDVQVRLALGRDAKSPSELVARAPSPKTVERPGELAYNTIAAAVSR